MRASKNCQLSALLLDVYGLGKSVVVFDVQGFAAFPGLPPPQTFGYDREIVRRKVVKALDGMSL